MDGSTTTFRGYSNEMLRNDHQYDTEKIFIEWSIVRETCTYFTKY